MGMSEAEAAFAAGYAASDERQRYYQERPGEGVPMGYDPPVDPWRPPPRGLGFSAPPDPCPVYEADSPGLVPHVLPVPQAVDLGAGPALTGATHGGWQVYPASQPVDRAAFVTVEAPALTGAGYKFPPGPRQAFRPRRRSLLRRLLGRA